MTATILTHGDHDGMVCAIMLLRRYPEAALRFSNDRNLARDLHAVAATEPPPAELLIADIALGPRQHDAMREAVRAVAVRGTAIRLFDHHTGWRSHSDLPELFATFCVDDQRTTAAVLVRRECLPDDGEAGFWLSVLSRKGASPETAMHFALLAALQNRENYGINTDILRALARDRTMRPEWAALAEAHRAREARALAEALAVAETLTTTQGRRVGWLDRRASRDRIFVDEQVMRAHGWDLVANATARKVTLGGAHIDSGVSLRALHGAHDVAGVRLQVVGHDSPVAITPLGRGGSTDSFLRAVRKLIVERL